MHIPIPFPCTHEHTHNLYISLFSFDSFVAETFHIFMWSNFYIVDLILSVFDVVLILSLSLKHINILIFFFQYFFIFSSTFIISISIK